MAEINSNDVDLDEDDFFGIQQLVYLEQKCTICHKSLRHDPQTRSVWIMIEPNKQIKKIKLLACNTCGLRYNKLKHFSNRKDTRQLPMLSSSVLDELTKQGYTSEDYWIIRNYRYGAKCDKKIQTY